MPKTKKTLDEYVKLLIAEDYERAGILLNRWTSALDESAGAVASVYCCVTRDGRIIVAPSLGVEKLKPSAAARLAGALGEFMSDLSNDISDQIDVAEIQLDALVCSSCSMQKQCLDLDNGRCLVTGKQVFKQESEN